MHGWKGDAWMEESTHLRQQFDVVSERGLKLQVRTVVIDQDEFKQQVVRRAVEDAVDTPEQHREGLVVEGDDD